MDLKIFVEGIADIKFIKDYFKHTYKRVLNDDEVIQTKGWSTIKSNNDNSEQIINHLQRNTDNDGLNIVIFDADDDFSERLSQLEEWKEEKELDFKTFLWPNNLDKGDLEVVLKNIINIKNKPILECWEGYENCLKSKTIDGRSTPLTTPARKTMVYAYLEALLGESKSQKEKLKEKKRDYCNASHWNLDSEYLSPLKEFLDDSLE